MTLITNAANILEECFIPSTQPSRIIIEGKVPIGKAARVSPTPIEEVNNDLAAKEDLIKQLRLENENLKKSVNVKPGFRWTVRVAIGLTMLAFLVMIVLTFQGEMSEQQSRLFEVCDSTWKIGFAAIIGLIGGKIA